MCCLPPADRSVASPIRGKARFAGLLWVRGARDERPAGAAARPSRRSGPPFSRVSLRLPGGMAARGRRSVARASSCRAEPGNGLDRRSAGPRVRKNARRSQTPSGHTWAVKSASIRASTPHRAESPSRSSRGQAGRSPHRGDPVRGQALCRAACWPSWLRGAVELHAPTRAARPSKGERLCRRGSCGFAVAPENVANVSRV